MKAVYALSLLAAAVSALSFKTDPFWREYKKTYSKSYEHDAEEERRYQAFNKNMAYAAELNALGDDAEYGMTPLSDRFPEEIFTHVAYPENVEREPAPTAEQVSALPSSFDSRTKNWVPAVRDQGQCGSCWAFAAVAVMDIAYAKKHSTAPPVLSEQQVVDCDTVSYGCDGGWAYYAAVSAQNGIMLNAAYPYRARRGTCQFNAVQAKTKVTSTAYLSQNNVDAMKQEIVDNGAVAVALDADKLQSYRSGIVSASGCSTTSNHVVTAIGWGNEGSTKYWIVRNSWGSGWGENGYFRIVLGQNACGVELWPVKIRVA